MSFLLYDKINPVLRALTLEAPPNRENVLQSIGLEIDVTNQNLIKVFMFALVLPIFLFQVLSIILVPLLIRYFPHRKDNFMELVKNGKIFELINRTVRSVVSFPIAVCSVILLYYPHPQTIYYGNLISIGFMLYHVADTIMLLSYGAKEKMIYIHHTIVLCLFTFVLYTRKFSICSMGGSSFDVLVPFSTVLAWSYNLNRVHTKLHLSFSILSIAIILLHRSPLILWLFYQVITSGDLVLGLPYAILSGCILIMELKWVVGLVKISIKSYRGIKKAKTL